MRHHLGRTKPSYLPMRRPGDHLQVIAVTNFKGGSGKTTTSIHLAQFLALRGYRVLAVDLDPQASMSAMLGYQPEFDVGENETLYGAIKYDETRRDVADIVRQTYFPGLDLIPGNLELHEFEHDTPKALADTNRDDEDMPGRLTSVIFAILLLSMWTNLLARTYAWMVLLQRTGLINKMLIGMGLIDKPLALVNNLTGVTIGM